MVWRISDLGWELYIAVEPPIMYTKKVQIPTVLEQRSNRDGKTTMCNHKFNLNQIIYFIDNYIKYLDQQQHRVEIFSIQ